MKNAAHPKLTKKDVRRGLSDLLRCYVESCRPPPDADPKKAAGRLPNLAGFLRSAGYGFSDFEELRRKDPVLSDRILTVLEDEALTYCASSATVVTAYLKRRLGYADPPEKEEKQTDCGPVRLIFDHDIVEDGG